MKAQDATGPDDLARRLVEEQGRFLAFLRRRLPDASSAEDVLQAAYMKVLDRGGTLRDSDSVVAWFYRVLRHALIDHQRREGARSRAVERAAQARPRGRAGEDAELHDAVCACVGGLLGTLRPEQADLLRRVELGDESVGDAAARLGVTSNNLSVRLHRARSALRERVVGLCGACAHHGCLACTCRGPQAAHEAGPQEGL